MFLTRLASMALTASLLTCPAAKPAAAAGPVEVVVASGTMNGRFLARALFHIGEFWMQVPPNTEFNRWLSQGLDRNVVIMLSNDTSRFSDVVNVRILSGTLVRNISAAVTPATEDVMGRLPEGDMAYVHELFLKDEPTGILGAVTFETADRLTASKFEDYVGKPVNVIIRIE